MKIAYYIFKITMYLITIISFCLTLKTYYLSRKIKVIVEHAVETKELILDLPIIHKEMTELIEQIKVNASEKTYHNIRMYFDGLCSKHTFKNESINSEIEQLMKIISFPKGQSTASIDPYQISSLLVKIINKIPKEVQPYDPK